MNPGPKIGMILNALMEEVLDDPKLNSEQYLVQRTQEFLTLPEADLRKIADKGKEKKEQEEQKELGEIRAKHYVS